MNALLSTFSFSAADGAVFALFILAVLVISIVMSFMGKKKNGAESYFLAGRGLPWWLIGFSLIAANISTEQFIGMSGNASQCTGLAIASYEWIAAISLVFVAFVFVPKFLRCGIYTIPQFLEYRYNKLARTLMSLSMIIILCAVTIAVVINSGALTIDVLFSGMSVFGIPINIVTAGWFIGILAAVYVFTGGLKACAWADLLQGSGLLIGGFVIMLVAFNTFAKKDAAELGITPEHVRPIAYQGKDLTEGVTADTQVWKKFTTVNQDKLHMARPNTDPNIVWTTLLLGIWIPNLYYWGLNQYIMQRTLGAKSLAEGQKGIVFAAAMKLAIPFIIVFPGIIAFNLYHEDMKTQAQTDATANADSWGKLTDIVIAPWKAENKITDEVLKQEASAKDDARPATNKLKDKLKEIASIDGMVAEFEANKDNIKKLVLEDKKNGKRIFKFNEDFAVLHPESAKFILDYNTFIADNIDVTADAEKLKKDFSETYPDIKLTDKQQASFDLFFQNSALLSKLAEVDYPTDMPAMAKYTRRLQENFGLVSPAYPVQKELVGYKFDAAFPLLLRNLDIPNGLRGFVLAALLGAVISSLASMLNAASTIFTMDIYKEYIHKIDSDSDNSEQNAGDKVDLNAGDKVDQNAAAKIEQNVADNNGKKSSQGELVFVGRVCVILAMIAGCLISPILSDPKFGGLFKFIQEFQGFISPGILAIFIVGLMFNRTRGAYGVLGLLASPIIYGALMLVIPEVNFLNRMAITFVSITVGLSILTLILPAKEAKALPRNDEIELVNSKGAIVAGVLVCIATISLYYVFF